MFGFPENEWQSLFGQLKVESVSDIEDLAKVRFEYGFGKHYSFLEFLNYCCFKEILWSVTLVGYWQRSENYDVILDNFTIMIVVLHLTSLPIFVNLIHACTNCTNMCFGVFVTVLADVARALCKLEGGSQLVCYEMKDISCGSHPSI